MILIIVFKNSYIESNSQSYSLSSIWRTMSTSKYVKRSEFGERSNVEIKVHFMFVLKLKIKDIYELRNKARDRKEILR